MLKKRRMSAGEIGSHFDMTGATISYHLSILKKAKKVGKPINILKIHIYIQPLLINLSLFIYNVC